MTTSPTATGADAIPETDPAAVEAARQAEIAAEGGAGASTTPAPTPQEAAAEPTILDSIGGAGQQIDMRGTRNVIRNFFNSAGLPNVGNFVAGIFSTESWKQMNSEHPEMTAWGGGAAAFMIALLGIKATPLGQGTFGGVFATLVAAVAGAYAMGVIRTGDPLRPLSLSSDTPDPATAARTPAAPNDQVGQGTGQHAAALGASQAAFLAPQAEGPQVLVPSFMQQQLAAG